MMNDFKPPPRLSFDGDVAHNWTEWLQMFTLYMEATESTSKTDATKIAMLLTCMGPDGVRRFNQFAFSPDTDKDKYDKVVDKFTSELSGEKRVVFNRFKFWEYKWSDHQGFDDFIVKLRALGDKCDFVDAEYKNILRDKIVFSIGDKRLQERLLREKDLSYDRAVEICHAAEVTHRELQSMSQSSRPSQSRSVNAVVKHGRKSQSHSQSQAGNQAGPSRPQSGAGTFHQARRSSSHMTSHAQQSPSKGKCGRCGNSHGNNLQSDCPAWGHMCYRCKGQNHFRKFCRAKTVHTIQVDSESEDDYFLGSLECEVGCVHRDDNCRAWFEIVQVAGANIRMKVDTGAETNSIPVKTWLKIVDRPNLTPSRVTLRAFGGATVPHEGSAQVKFSVNGHDANSEIFVTSDKTVPILGLRTSAALGLVRPGCNATGTQSVDSVDRAQPINVDSLKEHPYCDAFEGLGKFPGQYSITRTEGASGFVEPMHRVPHKLVEPLKSKLADMESQGVIEKVDYPTDFVNNLVITHKKNGSIRICLDPKHLNQQIRREHFPIPTFVDVASQLGNKKIFTIIDLKDSYWQIELDNASSDLTTFSTPFGRYKFRRLPFGICSAAEILQKNVYRIFGDIKDTHAIADDLLIATEDEESHDEVLRLVIKRAMDNNVRFNFKKLQLKKSAVVYYGVHIGADGLKPDPEKIRAILEMPDPTDPEAVKRLTGMLNFLSTFIPNKSTLIAPISSLLRSGVPWNWGPAHREAMQQIKDILSSEPVLTLFDPALPVTLQADASSTGLGACLMQRGQPVAYASRALTSAETRYAQIEKEMLAILFAATKFHHFIYGAEAEVESDHKPLESIMLKPLHQVSPRMQMMLLKLLKYNLTVKYVPGSRLYIADTLSRAYTQDTSDEALQSQLQEGEYRIHTVTQYLPTTPERVSELREATVDDPVLQRLRPLVSNGWPVHRSSLAPELFAYWPLRGEIHEEDGILFAGEKLLVPVSMRSDLLTRLHEGHAGAEKCRARAAEIMYWPNMNRDIDNMVADCPVCATYSRQNQREPMIPHSMPTRPWAKLGSDIFEFGGHDYLIVVDYYSKYPEIERLTSKTAAGVIGALKSIMARHGIPDELVSDNMPFGSAAFRQFAHDWGFIITTSSPRYPQSNGQSERFVQTAKNYLKKAYADGKDVFIALLEYRNTPIAGISASPAQLLMSRRLKAKLPVTSSLLQPAVVSGTRDRLVLRQWKQKHYYDRGTKTRRKFRVGDPVRVRLGKTWDHAVVSQVHDAPRSYVVTMPEGQSYRRNQGVINQSPDVQPASQVMDTYPGGGSSQSPTCPLAPHEQAEPTFAKQPEDQSMERLEESPPDSSPARRSHRVRRTPKWHQDYEFDSE